MIIPTDGDSIDPVFWQILEKFSPDHVVSYAKTLGDMAIAEPTAFAGVVERHARAWVDAGGEDSPAIRDQIAKDLQSGRIDEFDLSLELKSQLATRLVPFHFEQHFETISCGGVHWHKRQLDHDTFFG